MEIKSNEEIVLNDCPQCFAVHPGSILREELRSRGLKQKDFAKKIGMEPPHLSALIHGIRNVTSGIAAKLESGLGIPATLWLNLQTQYNLSKKQTVAQGLPAMVDGYSSSPESSIVLGDSALHKGGAGKEIRVTLPDSDLPWFLSLAKRMGWGIMSETKE